MLSLQSASLFLSIAGTVLSAPFANDTSAVSSSTLAVILNTSVDPSSTSLITSATSTSTFSTSTPYSSTTTSLASSTTSIVSSTTSTTSIATSVVRSTTPTTSSRTSVVSSKTSTAPIKTTPVPQFVRDYAPKVWLHSQDPYLPSDLNTHLSHVVAKNNFNAVAKAPNPLNTSNLVQLNSLGGGSNNYLTSKDDPATYPGWFRGNAPDKNGKTAGTTAAVIVVDKGDGRTIDAFYFYFYSFNYGGNVKIPVFNIKLGNFGNHVGDWEHNMIRFVNGKPSFVWYSQHANGEAFQYKVLQKDGLRPYTYSASGSHANYAIPGKHDHTIPNLNFMGDGLLTDDTNTGKLWDPLLSANFYSYNTKSQSFSAYDGKSDVSWLNFNGKWGDQQYPKSDKRQKDLFGNARWSSGPTGPKDKKLDRKNVCPDNGNPCILRYWLQAKKV